jgi:hypothetical protein
MSVLRIRTPFLDATDPFWICRVLALKGGAVTILLFLCNAFLNSPQAPVSFMLTTLVAVLASEVIPSESKWGKLTNFLSIIVLLSTAGMFFGLLSYFRLALFLFAVSFTYVALRFLIKGASSAGLPVIILLWGFMQLEGGAATNLTAVAGNLLYYFEFAFMGVITIALFPDFTPSIFKSAFLRILESNLRNVGNPNYRNSQPAVLTALHTMQSTLPRLPDSYKGLYESIVAFQAEFMRPHHLTEPQREQAMTILQELAEAVGGNRRFADRRNQLQQATEHNLPGSSDLRRLIESYDQCRV